MEPTTVTLVVGLIGTALSVLGTLAGIGLGAKLNRHSTVETAKQLMEIDHKKYTQTRIWDARKDAYTNIIAKLRSTSRICHIIDRNYNDGQMDEQVYHDTDLAAEQRELMWETMRECRTYYENTHLLLSNDFTIRFEGMEDAIRREHEEDLPPPQAYRNFSRIFREAFRRLSEIAKSDIRGL